MNETHGPLAAPPPARVLMLTSDSAIGGTERIILSLLRHIDGKRFRPSLVAMFGPGDLVDEARALGVEALNLRMREGSKTAALREWMAFLRRENPHVIQSLLIHSNLLGRLTVLARRDTALLAGISTVYTAEGYGRAYAWLERCTHWLDTLYCVNSELGLKQVREAIRLPARKLALVHNGIPLLEQPDRNEVRAELVRTFGLPESSAIVGIVAHMRPQKRHDLLIRAFAKALDRFPDSRLLIVGGGETETRMRQLAADLGAADRVVFAGFQPEARRMMRGMDVFALPSDVEGEPVSVMEAMDAGLPVLACRTGGIPEIVEDGITGILTRPGDLDGFALALESLLGDARLRKRMGEAGRARVREKFSAERMTREFEALYLRCLEAKQPRRG